MSIKEPDQSVWNRFWQRKNDMDKVYPSSPSIIEAIKKNFKLEGLKVLEVGAGTGRDSAELARLGADVYVLDFADNSLKIVNSLRESEGLKNLHLVRGDAFKSPFPDNTFDLVFHQGLAEHFKDSLPLLQENFRIVKHGRTFQGFAPALARELPHRQAWRLLPLRCAADRPPVYDYQAYLDCARQVVCRLGKTVHDGSAQEAYA